MKRLKRGEEHPVRRFWERVNTRSCGCLFVLFGMIVNPSIAHEVVGKVTVLKGVVTAKVDEQPVCRLIIGSGVYLQDQLETRDNSFVVIKMNDDSKLTLSPGSVMQVEAYQDRSVQQESDSASIKNKLREISGLIGQSRSSEASEKHTATIGIRGPITMLRECVDRDLLVDASKPAQ